ncbi:MAG TPA: TerC family protein [Polyangiaceae bacterium]
MTSAATPLVWIGFTIFVLAMLTIDLGVFHRRAHVIRTREALVWTIVWIALALTFNVGIYLWMGSEKGLEFLTGYLIEKALSIDNLFVMMVIFSYFAVPAELQHRVLFWGIVGALLLRAVFILVGAALLQHFHWFIYVFGGILLVTGIRLAFQREGHVHPERNPVLRIMRKFIPSVADYRGSHFTVVESGRRYATPLLLVLLTIESTDVVFAVDSIPAIFAVTTDPFIVFTSNVFAILGLRALYFVLADVLGKLRYLKAGLALVLAFVGIKMLISGVYAIPIGVSLAVVATLVAAAIVASTPWRRAKAPDLPTGEPPLHPLPRRDSRQGA